MKNNLLLPLLALLLLASCTTKYYLVRHAERLNNTGDSPLSPAGHARAGILRDTLADKNISQIFASTFVRTQQTAQPLATAKNLELTLYRPDTTAGFIARLKSVGSRNVLVVGHSNTIPQIVEALSGEAVSIPEDDFDNLYIVTITRGWGQTKKTLVKTTYGPASP
ncbi:MAG: histidine phosphatase family protein [Lewinellaceae bacterium]|nr:histidine phosphatase family protein [Lewinellaceae bacterium]